MGLATKDDLRVAAAEIKFDLTWRIIAMFTFFTTVGGLAAALLNW